MLILCEDAYHGQTVLILGLFVGPNRAKAWIQEGRRCKCGKLVSFVAMGSCLNFMPISICLLSVVLANDFSSSSRSFQIRSVMLLFLQSLQLAISVLLLKAQ